MTGGMVPLRPGGYVDPGWEHGTAQDEKKKKVKCNYCGKVVSGGIYRLKQHLAQVSGEVTYCEKAPEDVYLKMRENLEGCRSNKKPKLSENNERAYLSFQSHDDDDDDVEHMGCSRKGKKVVGDKSVLLNWTPLRSLGYVDPGWEHGVAQDERKKKVKCNYCGKIVSGGINRFKQHLARIPGEVAPCKNAPDEVYLQIKENMKWHRTGRRHRRTDVKETSSFFMHSDDEPQEDEAEEDPPYHLGKNRMVIGDRRLGKDSRRRFSGISSGSCSGMYLKKSRSANALKTSVTEMPVTYKLGNYGANRQNHKEVVSAICEFFCYAGVPMHAASSLYFQKMLDLVGQYGQGLVGSSSRLLSGCHLQDELSTVRNYLMEYRTCWAVTGCSIMADSWKNAQGRTLINLLVSCPRGVHFFSMVDATDIVDDPPSLFKLLDEVVDEIRGENVVQVVTQNTPSYKAAGKMIEDKWRHIFWTPCATYSIDRALEDFTKIKLVSECIEKAQNLTKFIYNRVWLLNLMKKEFTGGQDILRPALTRHAAGFLSLQGILDHRNGLKRMFQSNKWLLCRFSKSDEGKEVEKTILNCTFWKKMQYVHKSVDPVLQVLQKVSSDGNLSMPYIYNEMYKAKLAIKCTHGDDARKYGPFWSVIDSHWKTLFQHPLCVAAYYLNPAFRYHSDCVANPEVMRGLNECLVRLEPDDVRRVSASTQVTYHLPNLFDMIYNLTMNSSAFATQTSDFVSAKADFGTELAISTRTELDPAVWWQQHGISCLELQRIAVRILSQTCSSFGCEHNWSIYDQIHCQRENRLAQKKLNDLLYPHYNLRLRERQIRQSNELISLDSVLLEGLLDDWVVDAEKQAMPDDEDILDLEDGYDYDVLDYEDRNSDTRRGSLAMVTPAEVEPLEVHTNAGPATDDEADRDFLDDDLSD